MIGHNFFQINVLIYKEVGANRKIVIGHNFFQINVRAYVLIYKGVELVLYNISSLNEID